MVNLYKILRIAQSGLVPNPNPEGRKEQVTEEYAQQWKAQQGKSCKKTTHDLPDRNKIKEFISRHRRGFSPDYLKDIEKEFKDNPEVKRVYEHYGEDEAIRKAMSFVESRYQDEEYNLEKDKEIAEAHSKVDKLLKDYKIDQSSSDYRIIKSKIDHFFNVPNNRMSRSDSARDLGGLLTRITQDEDTTDKIMDALIESRYDLLKRYNKLIGR